jgi:RNA polymerase sigma-70 factor (ECF subfamily)
MMRRRSVFAPARELSLEELMPAKQNVDGQMTIQIADWSALPEDQLLNAELKETLDDAIAQLPDSYRPVMLLRDVEELSTQETAQILDLSEDVVRTRLHRARLSVRKLLDERLRHRHTPPVASGEPQGERNGIN